MTVGRSRIGLVAGALLLPVVLLALLEIVLRIVDRGGSAPEVVRFDGAVPDDAAITTLDRELLYRLAPNSELLGFYRTNSRGYRGAEFPDPSESRFRIVAVGDSCTFGLGVRDAEAWPARLEALLDRAFSGAIDFEVLNLGVPGYSSFQNRRQIEREAERLGANGVVWMATGYNDALLARAGSDAEVAARLASPWSRLHELRIVELFRGKPTGFMGEGAELARISGGPPRVSVEEFEANVAAVLAPEPSRAVLSLEVFGTPLNPQLAAFDPSIPARRERLYARLGERADRSDPAASFAEFSGYELFVDAVHPGAEGQRLLAETAFRNIVRGDFLAPSPRRDWWRAVVAAWERVVTKADADLLSGPGAIPWFATLLAAGGDPIAFPDAARFDPLIGAERGEYEAGRLGMAACGAFDVDGVTAERAGLLRARMLEHVAPRDPFDRMLFPAGQQSAPSPEVVALARCLTVLRRWAGFSSLAVDRRAAALAKAPDPNAALLELDDVVALDARAWYPRRVRAELLRAAGRFAEAEAAIAELLSERPGDARTLAISGTIALQTGDHAAARAALEKAVEADPVQIEALYGLGRIALFEGRFDDAARRLGAVAALNAASFPDLAALREKATRKERIDRVNR